MRVAVISNCQGEGLSELIQRMSTTVSADFHLITKIQYGEISVDQVLQQYDIIFAQTILKPYVSAENESRVIYFPSIIFDGFHPDLIFIRGRNSGGEIATVNSAMVVYHSAIAVAGFVAGLSVQETMKHFNAEAYARLGYFDAYERARQDLMQEGRSVGMPLEGCFETWRRRGNFMFSSNHPDLEATADIAVWLLNKIGHEVVISGASRYMRDPLKAMPIWPVYPEIAIRLGVSGDYIFKRHDPHTEMTLEHFIWDSFTHMETFERDSLESMGRSIVDIQKAIGIGGEVYIPAVIKGNPYSQLPERQFWKKSVAGPRMEDVDPVTTPDYQISLDQKIATAGSCFAQHIARTLQKNGYNYFVPEQAPEGLAAEEASARNYNVYSARYGNVYTARQMVQLIERVNGNFLPQDECWVRPDGKLVDPFRPQIEPDGFADLESLRGARNVHFAATRRVFTEADIFVFTLGLTEGWRSRHDGAVYPLAPGVAGGEMDFNKYEFVNFTASEVVEDMHRFLAAFKTINPTCKVILTVSPVPLIATYEPKNALVATTLSKAVLRVAAEEITKAYDDVSYFPSYEIITGNFNRGAYFDEDLRTVKPEGVAHVMGLFMKHYVQGGGEHAEASKAEASVEPIAETTRNKLFDIVCDEEAIARF